MNIGSYAKSILLVIAAGIGILTAALTDGAVSSVEYVNIGIAVVGAVAVYIIPNLSAGIGQYAKFIVSGIAAALAALVVILGPSLGFESLGASDWLNVILAGLAAIGLYIVPNAVIKSDAQHLADGPSVDYNL